MKTNILEQIGLSKNEIKVYFALLELDQSLASKISEKTDLQTSHAMDVGVELQKAEVALKFGMEYVQDRPLNFNKTNQQKHQ